MNVHAKLITFFILLGFIFTGCSSSQNVAEGASKKPVVGVVFGTFDDTWRTVVRNELYKSSEGKVQMDIWSGNNSQDIENQKIDLLINRKVDALVVNLVEKSGASAVIEKAKKAGIPVVFFNIEPAAEDMKKFDQVYYVGAKAEQSGIMQGQILVDYFNNNPAKDGIVDYVMLKGPLEHQDAILRTQYSVKTMEEAGLKLRMLGEEIASWDRGKAQEKMQTLLASYGENMDCVIANNDDMALGAIDALKNKGLFTGGKYMPVAGVDATATAVNAIKDGSLLGTVLNDAAKQADAVYNLSIILANGKTPNKDNFSYPITESKYVWIEYKMITKQNVADVK